MQDNYKNIESLSGFYSVLKKAMLEAKQDMYDIYPEVNVHANNKDTTITTPFITHKTKERESAERSGRKPMYKNSFESKNQKDENLDHYSQRFECIVELSVYGSSYKEADDARKNLEAFIIDYYGFFRNKGLLELLLQKQLEDENEEINNQSFVKLPLLYYVRYEEVVEGISGNINDVNSSLQAPKEFEYIKNVINKK